MFEFFQAIQDPDLAFLRYGLGVGLLASIAFGIIGSYVVVKRISYIAGSIAHCVFGGIGAAMFLQKKMGILWCDPMLGATVAALIAAVIIGTVSTYAKQREDTAIGALWVIGMSAGILLLAKTPGYIDPMSFLFGNILMISTRDVWMVLALDTIIVSVGLLFYNKLMAVCFDAEFARLRGINSNLLYLLLLCLTALTIVLLVRIVGIIMVIALLTLPAAVAGHFAARLWHMMVISTLLSMFYITAGMAFSFSHNLPSGATIVMLGGIVYLLSIAAQGVRKLINRPFKV